MGYQRDTGRDRLPVAISIIVVLSVAYLIAGVYWGVGGRGFPFGIEHDPLAWQQSILEHVTQDPAAWWVTASALAGLLCALLMLRPARRPKVAAALSGLALAQFIAYTLIVPDGRPLIAAVHIPVLLAGKPFGWPPGVTISSQISWPVLNQAILLVLGTTWLAAAVLYGRRQRGACVRCGRTPRPETWTRPERAASWGRWAVAAAVTVPVFYAVTRIAWFLGLPLGVSRRFLSDEAADNPTIFTAGALLAVLALGGATLTLGLVQRWGEVYPRWIPFLGGRPVRPRTALVPATAVAVILTSAGTGSLLAAVDGRLPDDSSWGTTAPGALLPVWGLGLGVATYAYYLRRRKRCRQCGRGAGKPEAPASRPRRTDAIRP